MGAAQLRADFGARWLHRDPVDDVMRRAEHDDGPTIGIVLAAVRNLVVVEYALRRFDTPLA